MPSPRFSTVIGLMAGTSIDGIDASLVETDGEKLIRSGLALHTPYRDETRAMVFAAMDELTRAKTPERAAAAVPAKLHRNIADEHAEAVEALVRTGGIRPECVGFHGQTLFHDPQRRLSIQAGDAQGLADRLGLPVVQQFRQADIEAGGQGAPLAPVYHRALIKELELELPAGIVNIGGIANISRWDGKKLTGFDTGPGNALMDELAREVLGQEFDLDGGLAGQGSVDGAWLEDALGHPYFGLTGSKSLDRSTVLGLAEKPPSGSGADRMASYAALTAESVTLHAAGLKSLVLSGGGSRNPVLVGMIRDRCPATVTIMDDHRIDGDFIEAELMAFLAERSRRGLAITFPGTTGIPKAATGGELAMPESGSAGPQISASDDGT